MANENKHPGSEEVASFTGRAISWLTGRAPDGFLGATWGEEIPSAEQKIGIHCTVWNPWAGGHEYEAGFDADHPVQAFGQPAFVQLFRKAGRLAAISLRFENCGPARESLTAAVGKQFHAATDEGDPYKIFRDGSVVRLEYNAGSERCELTLTDPAFGKAYARYEFGSGLRDLAAGLGPH